MIDSLWSIFVINVGVNSLLSFLTLQLLVCLGLFILRIRNPRVRACCLVLPFIKLFADLASYQFSNWALAQDLNPFMSAEGTRMLSAGIWYAPFLHVPFSYINFYLQEGQTFTLADLLCLSMGPTWTLMSAIALLTGTLASLGYAIWQSYISRQWLNTIHARSTRYIETIQDPFLYASVQHKQVSIYLTQSSHPPFIAKQRQPSIFIPHALYTQLSTEEFESIIAHEIAHLRNGDLLCNAALFWIGHLFWWIPTRYFKKQVELAQEYACDRLLHTRLHRIHLANALYKASAWLKAPHPLSLAQPFAASHQAVERLKILLVPPKQEFRLLKWTKIALLTSWIITLSFGKFWTF